MSLDVPAQGEPTRQVDIQAIIDQLTALGAATWAVSTLGILSNGSFEIDDDANGIPDGWTFTPFTGGSGALDNTTSAHGRQSFKMISPGGASNGGGTLVNTECAECSPNRPLLFHWQLKSTVAGVKNKVEVDWYSSPTGGDYISTSTLWSEDTVNPADWICFQAGVIPPATARYFKIRLVGCDDSDSTAGSTWFDDVGVQPYSFSRRIEISTAGTYTFTAPSTGLAKVTLGGGGGAGGGNNGGGGGGGELCIGFVSIFSGTDYSFTVGAAGTGGAGAGTDGGDSTFQTTVLIAKGGKGGGASSVAGGAGGTGGTGDIRYAGQAGRNGAGHAVPSTGRGGDSYIGGVGGKGGTGGSDGIGPGAGGGGGAAGSNGKNGIAGKVIIEF